MKTLFFAFFLLFSFFVEAKNGLEKIIVERYYISNAQDTGSIGGNLPNGSTTYRVYVDMLPMYRFQAVYGIPGHLLEIKTSRKFYNHEDRGSYIANLIPDRNLSNNTLMLDSWLSAGAASEGSYGVLKREDDNLHTVEHSSGMLQNSNSQMKIPLYKSDGMKDGSVPRVTFFALDSAIRLFGNKTCGSILSTDNGSWACLNGAVGLDSAGSNRLLIGQFTTDGDFSFELNIQIGTPYGGVENYVARNPLNNEIVLPDLIYNTNKKKRHKK